MNNLTNLKNAALPGIIALAAILLSVSIPFNAVAVAAFAVVAMLVAIAALEYNPRADKRITYR